MMEEFDRSIIDDFLIANSITLASSTPKTGTQHVFSAHAQLSAAMEAREEGLQTADLAMEALRRGLAVHTRERAPAAIRLSEV